MSKRIREECLRLMSKPELVYVSTVTAEGYPQTRAVANTRCEALYPFYQPFLREQPPFRVFVATHGRSEKVRQIRQNAKSCVYFIVPEEFHSLALVGDLERVKDRAVKKALWHDAWNIHYPDGPLGRSFAVFALTPILGKGWYKNHPFEFTID